MTQIQLFYKNDFRHEKSSLVKTREPFLKYTPYIL